MKSQLWGAMDTHNGKSHLCRVNCAPVLFLTRKGCRWWIEERYGYIRTRPDLRRPPHNWRVPRAVRVTVEVAR